jgi:SAM-dependent methyltransferase
MEQQDKNAEGSSVAADQRVRSVAPSNSLRLQVFYRFLPAIMTFFRRRRMRAFLSLLEVRAGTTILDLGGAPSIWEHVAVPCEITILNLPGAVSPSQLEVLEHPSLRHHKFSFLEGDACNVASFSDGSFDIVFSNSVIEHVGPEDKQAQFAREVRRLGRAYWVQTPSKWFPIEAHTGVLFYWIWPEWVRSALRSRWRSQLPAWWSDYVESTRVLSRRAMADHFPDGTTRVEFFLGFPKSYVAFSTTPSRSPGRSDSRSNAPGSPGLLDAHTP